MTPMIDVVFLLLIFFIVTLRQDDLFSRLVADRPQVLNGGDSEVDLIEIVVHRQGLLFRGMPITIDALDRRLERYASISTAAPVIVKCTADSPHRLLVQALDLFSKHQMRHLSILSL
jgi:biopolymer transport protein ExbD